MRWTLSWLSTILSRILEKFKRLKTLLDRLRTEGTNGKLSVLKKTKQLFCNNLTPQIILYIVVLKVLNLLFPRLNLIALWNGICRAIP